MSWPIWAISRAEEMVIGSHASNFSPFPVDPVVGMAELSIVGVESLPGISVGVIFGKVTVPSFVQAITPSTLVKKRINKYLIVFFFFFIMRDCENSSVGFTFIKLLILIIVYAV